MGIRRGRVVPSLNVGAALFFLFAGVSPAQVETPKAPDGRPGLSGRGSAHDLSRVLVRPKTAEERQLAGDLLGLEAACELRFALAAQKLDERRCMDLVADKATGTLKEQTARFDELAARAATELAVGDDRARSFAVCLLDPAFGVRHAALRGVERELTELSSGLAILMASQSGFVSLSDEEASGIARRIDRSAALLRTLNSDMDLLEASDFAGEPLEEDAVDALIAAARIPRQDARAKLLQSQLDPIQEKVGRMAGSLSSSRLRRALSAELVARRAALEKAAARVPELDLLIPGRIAEELVPEEIQSMSKQDRHSLALRHALEGLAEDPFSPELTFYAAVATDWIADSTRSRPWFDRYLALRGVRAHDHRTYQGRKLAPDEQRALDVVQLGG